MLLGARTGVTAGTEGTGGVTGAGDGTGVSSGLRSEAGGCPFGGIIMGGNVGAVSGEGVGTACDGCEAGVWTGGVGAGVKTEPAQPVISERKSTSITNLALSIPLPFFLG